jgi:hypothetical protein
LPKGDPPDVTRFKAVRVNESIVRHLISRGYLSLESRELKAAVAIALEAWIHDNRSIGPADFVPRLYDLQQSHAAPASPRALQK